MHPLLQLIYNYLVNWKSMINTWTYINGVQCSLLTTFYFTCKHYAFLYCTTHIADEILFNKITVFLRKYKLLATKVLVLNCIMLQVQALLYYVFSKKIITKKKIIIFESPLLLFCFLLIVHLSHTFSHFHSLFASTHPSPDCICEAGVH